MFWRKKVTLRMLLLLKIMPKHTHTQKTAFLKKKTWIVDQPSEAS